MCFSLEILLIVFCYLIFNQCCMFINFYLFEVKIQILMVESIFSKAENLDRKAEHKPSTILKSRVTITICIQL